jgi:HK97 gp10 family phage protein
MKIKVKIEGRRQFERKLKQLSDVAKNQATQEALHAGAVLVHGEATLRSPVDTGNLRSSLNYSVGDTDAEIGTSVEYAPYVELGTSRQSAQPYLRPALDENYGKLKKLFSDIYAKHVKGVR